jgi:NADH-quinone oxidoreductase subunit J
MNAIKTHNEFIMVKDVLIILLIIFFSVNAIFSRRLIYAAIALGLSSGLLAIIFFDLDAPFAGGFELSVGAGLISLLFIMAISLTKKGPEINKGTKRKTRQEKKNETKAEER